MHTTHYRRAAIAAWMAAGLIILFIGWATHAVAQGVVMITPLQCNLTADMVKQLGAVYKEVAIGAGLSSKGDQVRLFVSKTNSFTVLVTRPGGISCIATAGEDWNSKPIGDDT